MSPTLWPHRHPARPLHSIRVFFFQILVNTAFKKINSSVFFVVKSWRCDYSDSLQFTSALTAVSFVFQRHQEHWSPTARPHEEASIQHPGLERRDQLPQRVCSVIQAFLQIKVHWPTMPFHSRTTRTRGGGELWNWAVRPSPVEPRGVTDEDPPSRSEKNWD